MSVDNIELLLVLALYILKTKANFVNLDQQEY